MDTPATDFLCAGTLEELKAKGRLVVHGPHRPMLVVYDRVVFSRSTIVALIWAFRWIAAASRTAR
jgi:hypothetical protein